MSYAMLILRLALGAIMVAHGAQKLFGWFGGPGPEGFLGWMGSMGVPAAIGWLAIVAEFFGGIAVLLGAFARVGALMFAVNMLVAMFAVHAPHGFFMGGESGSGIEFTLMLLAASLAIVIAGPGRYALAPEIDNPRTWRSRGAARGPVRPAHSTR
jgi:putative oxidoreductase